jgi:hypothetical protein
MPRARPVRGCAVFRSSASRLAILVLLGWSRGTHTANITAVVTFNSTFQCPPNSTSAAGDAGPIGPASCFCDAGHWDIRNCSDAFCVSLDNRDTKEFVIIPGNMKDDRIEAYAGICNPCTPGAQH